MEGRVVATHQFGAPHAEAYGVEAAVDCVHVDEKLVVTGRTNYIDPMNWDSLIVKFAQFSAAARTYILRDSQRSAGQGPAATS
jgi:hypothetical protein